MYLPDSTKVYGGRSGECEGMGGWKL